MMIINGDCKQLNPINKKLVNHRVTDEQPLRH